MKWEHLRNQPEGVQFTNKDGKVTINDLDLNLNNDDDNDSSASDEGFDHDKEYQEEFEKKEKTRFEALATDEVQDNHFQLSFPNSFIPRLKPYCGVDRRLCRPLMLLYIVIALNMYISVLVAIVPLFQYGLSKFEIISFRHDCV